MNNFRALLKTFEFFPSDKVTALSEANTTPFLSPIIHPKSKNHPESLP
ncbi:hypothetical protein SPAR48_1061 [Streptococcus pneumoniae SPAR48]|nr:hypothetical protein SPAR48_1061 [Streptococcus pneumoniae SPAR48]